jgi:hypothetical protein
MLSCFAGSALLHAIPQYLSTYNLIDSLMIGKIYANLLNIEINNLNLYIIITKLNRFILYGTCNINSLRTKPY